MSGPNFWNNGVEGLNGNLIPWGVYNVSSATPDVSGWITDFGPSGSSPKGQFDILMQPAIDQPTTTATMTFQITGPGETSTDCWGTLWFAFVPYNTANNKPQGGGSTQQTRIYLLQIDSAADNNQSGWYYMDQMTDTPTLIASVSVSPPPLGDEPFGIWFYFDYENQMAYTGMNTGTGAGGQTPVGADSLDGGKGVSLDQMLQGTSSNTGFGYLLAFIKLDVADVASNYGGVGPVRIWTDPLTCCLPQGWTGGVLGSVDCSNYSPATSSCTNIVGSNSGQDPTGYCDANPSDPMCACQNGPFDSTVQNQCFAAGCNKSQAYWAGGSPSCSTQCDINFSSYSGGNVDWSNVKASCDTPGWVTWIGDNWYFVAAGGAGLVILLGLFLVFWSGWL